MTRNALAQVGAYIVIIGGLLVPAAGHAQSDYSPAKNNCNTATGCANYATGDVTSKNPAKQSTSNSPYDNQYSPAKNNCDTKTGCADYATGNVSPDNPAQKKQKQKAKSKPKQPQN